MQSRIEAYYDHFPPKNMNVSVTQAVVETGDGQSIRKNILIINKDVDKDEEIYLENPVVAALDADLESSGSNCSHCLRKIDSAMSLNMVDDPLCTVYCSKTCQTKALAESHNILFGLDPPLPNDPSTVPPSGSAKRARRAAQEMFVAHLKSSGRVSPLLVAKFISRQVSAEVEKIRISPTGVSRTSGTGAFSDGEYSLSDHIERLRYLELPAQEEESKLIAKLFETAMQGLEQSVYDEKYVILKGKMAYNMIGICYAGGRNDKRAPKGGLENEELSRTPYGTERQVGYGLYPVSSYICHSCKPSVRPSFSDGTSSLHLIANHALRRGEEVTMAYVDVSQHSGETMTEARLRRRKELARGWRFACACPLCVEEGPEGDMGQEKARDESRVEAVYSRYEENRATEAEP